MFGQTPPRVLIGSISLLGLLAGLVSGCVSAAQRPAEVREEAASPQSGNGSKASIEDRRQAETAIRSYFDARDRGDCTAMRDSLAAPLKSAWVSDICTHNAEHARFRVINLQGILQDQPGEFRPVSADTFTDRFMVDLEVKPIQPSPWNDGTNTRFVNVVRESDGRWRVSSIASSP